MNPLEEVLTPRMRLTRPTDADRPDLARFHADPRVMATLNGVRGPDESRAIFDRMAAHWLPNNFGWWIARDRATGAFLGRGGLRLMLLDGVPEVEIGYGFMADVWNRGLATELARESIRIGFESLKVPSLVCFTMPTNLASRRVMEKVGFTYERDGTWAALPHVFYRLTRT
ncbi:MAG: GNAT family N-acetyltransferase [Gemmataceae bacterium]